MPPSTAAVHPFDAATAVTPLDDGQPGRFAANLDPAWSGGVAPHGGVLAAMVTRAMSAVVGDAGLAPRSLTLHYLRAPEQGALEISITLRRSGRRTANLTAAVTQGQRECVLALATFGRELQGLTVWSEDALELAPFAQAIRVPHGAGRPPFMDFLDMRVGLGPAPFTGAQTAVTGGWLQFAVPRRLDSPAVAFFTDAWFPTPFIRLSGPSHVPTLDLTIHFRDALTPPLQCQPVAVRFASVSAASGIFTEDGTVWTADGRLIAQSRQSALLLPAASEG